MNTPLTDFVPINLLSKLFVVLSLCLVGVWADTPMREMHPSMELINFRPSELRPQVTGIGWLSNGDMVFSHWNGIQQNVHSRQDSSMVYIMKGASGDNPNNVTYHTFAEDLEDVLGLVVVNDEIYISGGTTITRLVDTNNDEKADRYDTIWHADVPRGRHEFFFGLVHKDGKLYGLLSSEKGSNLRNANRGTWISVDIATGNMEVLAAGFREPNGISIGPEGEMFAPDVQGNWLPSCKINHLVKGRFYGFKSNIAGPEWENLPDADPAVYMPQIEMARAPSSPLVIQEGPYRGQMLMGDVAYGGLIRIFLEKVNGEYQGSVFDFAGGMEAGLEKIAYGPDGHIYLGGMGSMGGWWGWNDPTASWRLFGFQKIKHTSGTAFEMMAVRSKGPQTLEIEFTKPADNVASSTNNYEVIIWEYVSTSAYGGPKVNEDTLNVQAANLSADGRRVTLTVPGLKEKFVVYIGLGDIRSTTGDTLWTNRTYYTLNSFGPGIDIPVPVEKKPNQISDYYQLREKQGIKYLNIIKNVAYDVSLYDVKGFIIRNIKGSGPGLIPLNFPKSLGVYTLIGSIGEESLTKTVFINP